jgi:hypothetical protein
LARQVGDMMVEASSPVSAVFLLDAPPDEVFVAKGQHVPGKTKTLADILEGDCGIRLSWVSWAYVPVLECGRWTVPGHMTGQLVDTVAVAGTGMVGVAGSALETRYEAMIQRLGICDHAHKHPGQVRYAACMGDQVGVEDPQASAGHDSGQVFGRNVCLQNRIDSVASAGLERWTLVSTMADQDDDVEMTLSQAERRCDMGECLRYCDVPASPQSAASR